MVVNSILGGFEPRTVDLNPGGTLTVTNNDTMTHTFTSQAIDGDGDPLFDVRVPAGATKSIPVSALGGGTLRLLLPDPPTDDRHADDRRSADGSADDRPRRSSSPW